MSMSGLTKRGTAKGSRAAFWAFALLMPFVLLLAACGGDPTPTPTQAPAPTPTEAMMEPTPDAMEPTPDAMEANA